MKNSRGLMALVIASMLGLFSTFAVADEATKNNLLSWNQVGKVKKPKAQHKFAKAPRPVTCSLYSQLSYLAIGSFWDPYNSDRFTRQGLVLGNGCYYTYKWLRVGLGGEFYNGSSTISHIEPGFNGTVYFEELSVRQWIYTALLLGKTEIAFTAGLQKMATSDLKVKDLYLDPGTGWLNLGLFATDTLRSSVDVKTVDLEVNATIPLNKSFSLTFGVLWLKLQGAIHIDFTMYGKTILQYFEFYDLETKKEIAISTDLVYFTPGIKWCKKNVCLFVTVPWGVRSSDAWAVGGKVGLEWKF